MARIKYMCALTKQSTITVRAEDNRNISNGKQLTYLCGAIISLKWENRYEILNFSQ